MSKKTEVQIAIKVSKEDHKILRQYILDMEDLGITGTKAFHASRLFKIGLHNEINVIANNK